MNDMTLYVPARDGVCPDPRPIHGTTRCGCGLPVVRTEDGWSHRGPAYVRPTYRAVEDPDLGVVYRTSDGSTFLTEDDASLHADPFAFDPGLCPDCGRDLDRFGNPDCATCAAEPIPSWSDEPDTNAVPTHPFIEDADGTCARCGRDRDAVIGTMTDLHPDPTAGMVRYVSRSMRF